MLRRLLVGGLRRRLPQPTLVINPSLSRHHQLDFRLVRGSLSFKGAWTLASDLI